MDVDGYKNEKLQVEESEQDWYVASSTNSEVADLGFQLINPAHMKIALVR